MSVQCLDSTSGPKRREEEIWEEKRQKIIHLYEQKRLAEVMDVMSSEENFVASRRMYQGRLKKWGVRKHMTRDDKEKLLSELTETSKQNLAPNERRKIRRYRADKRKQKESKTIASVNQLPQFKEDPEVLPNDWSSMNGPFDLDSEVGLVDSKDSSNVPIPLPQLLSSGSTWQTREEAEQMSSRSTSPTSIKEKPHARKSDWVLGKSKGITPMSLESPLKSDPRVCNVSWVVAFTRDLVRRHACNQFNKQNITQSAIARSPLPVEKYLTRLNRQIYLLKLRDWRKGEPLYYRLRTASWDSFLNLTPNFLRKFFAVISPIKYLDNPEVRLEILKHFLCLARVLWGDDHPFTKLVRQLQLDSRSREVTEKALACIYQSVGEQSGYMEYLRPNIEFRAKTSIIALQRRSKDTVAAEQSASQLFAHSKEVYGLGSLEARDAAEQLSHAYMDSGNFYEAQTLCLQRVGPAVASDGMIGNGYNDERAMRAMEDLAEIEKKRGRLQHCMTWLKAAAYCAIDTHQPDIFILHIVNKLMEAAKMSGRTEEALFWRTAFTRDVWKKPDPNIWAKLDAGLSNLSLTQPCESNNCKIWRCNKFGFPGGR